MTEPSGRPATRSLDDRYGRRRRPVQHAAWLTALVLIVAALLGWLAYTAWFQSQTPAGGQVNSYDVMTPHRVKVTVDLYRTNGSGVACTVQAVASDHTIVGQQVARLAAGPAGQHAVVMIVRTYRDATSASVSNCRSTRVSR
ncbi:MAG: DUF4307 domain-containing protein [Nocardioidaceae bacterium]